MSELLPLQPSIPNLDYIPDFLPEDLSKRLYQNLLEGVEWIQPKLKLFGRGVRTPRLVGFMADAGVTYQYSGYRHSGQTWSEEILALKQQLEVRCKTDFNTALFNCYRDGRDYMGWHSDNEAELGNKPCVASVSLGVMRDFKIRNKQTGCTFCLPLDRGSLLFMGVGFQDEWQHALPKRLGVKEPRINITFRNVVSWPNISAAQ